MSFLKNNYYPYIFFLVIFIQIVCTVLLIISKFFWGINANVYVNFYTVMSCYILMFLIGYLVGAIMEVKAEDD